MKGQIKTAEDIALLREGGKRLARVLRALEKEVRPGVTTKSLDDLAYKLITEGGDEPAFLNYTPQGAPRPYPATLCVSINDEIVHGIPNEEEKILQEGDIVSLDIGLAHQGRFVDMASTLPVGAVDAKALELLEVTKAALMAGIQAAGEGAAISMISVKQLRRWYKRVGLPCSLSSGDMEWGMQYTNRRMWQILRLKEKD